MLKYIKIWVGYAKLIMLKFKPWIHNCSIPRQSLWLLIFAKIFMISHLGRPWWPNFFLLLSPSPSLPSLFPPSFLSPQPRRGPHPQQTPTGKWLTAYAQAPSKVPECNGGTVRRCMSVYLLFA